MKQKKEEIKNIIEFLKTPRGKMCFFFGFYILFFTVLAILFHYDEKADKTKQDIDRRLPFSVSNIESRNYHFKYSYNIDDKSYIYEGDRNKDKQLFNYNDATHYGNGDIYSVKKENTWETEEDPYIMSNFLDINKIVDIALKSKIVSKTQYESGMRVYTYQISTTTLVKLLERENIDLDDPVNKIIFKTDETNRVNDIKYNLTSYCKYKNISKNTCKIELEYSKFGKIKDIKDPE